MNIEFFKVKFLVLTAVMVFGLAMTAVAQTTVFTYQGRFIDATQPQPTNGSYEMQFKLFDAAAVGTGNQVGAAQNVASVSVVNGIFTVPLDFGGTVFRSVDLFVEIGVRPVGSQAAFTILAPRQQLTTAPMAIRSRVANSADDSNALGGIPANQYVQTNDARLSDDRNPNPFSANYIQNQTANSQAANFNIGGNATIGGNISGNGTNISALNAGNITTGTLLPTRGGTGLTATGISGNFLRSNGTIWTSSALTSSDIPTNLDGYIQNSTVLQPSSNFRISGNGTIGGTVSGNIVNSTTNFRIANTIVFSIPNPSSVVIGGGTSNHTLSGLQSTFVGTQAGEFSNNLSSANTFIGYLAGRFNTSGKENTFVGNFAGNLNVTGSFTSFFGSFAGNNNKVDGSSFFGYQAGSSNGSGLRNSFFGFQAGEGNQSDNDNSFFGYNAGMNSFSGSSNSFFGSSAGIVNSTGDQNSFFGSSSGLANNSGSENAFFGEKSGFINTTGTGNTFVGFRAGETTVSDSFNTALGYRSLAVSGNGNIAVGSGAVSAGGFSTTVGYNSFANGLDNTIVGSNVTVGGGISVNHSTAIGSDAVVTTNNTIMLGTNIDTVRVPKDIFTAGTAKSNIVQVTGLMLLPYLTPPLLGDFPLCINTTNVVYRCGSPINIASSLPNPQNNEVSQTEIVKSNKSNADLVNYVKEQQTQIAAQAEQIKQQQIQLEALKQIVCQTNPAAQICVIK